MVYCINYFIILLGREFFQFAVKLAKIFEQKCKLNWKVQASAPDQWPVNFTQEDQM